MQIPQKCASPQNPHQIFFVFVQKESCKSAFRTIKPSICTPQRDVLNSQRGVWSYRRKATDMVPWCPQDTPPRGGLNFLLSVFQAGWCKSWSCVDWGGTCRGLWTYNTKGKMVTAVCKASHHRSTILLLHSSYIHCEKLDRRHALVIDR